MLKKTCLFGMKCEQMLIQALLLMSWFHKRFFFFVKTRSTYMFIQIDVQSTFWIDEGKKGPIYIYVHSN